MSRNAVIVFTLAALFGLRSPLCMLACAEATSQPVAAVASHDDAAPCHGTEAPAPADLPVGGFECDCDRFQVVAQKADPASHGGAQALALPGPLLPTAWAPSGAPHRLHDPRQDLPPPDLLLLNSTLLL